MVCINLSQAANLCVYSVISIFSGSYSVSSCHHSHFSRPGFPERCQKEVYVLDGVARVFRVNLVNNIIHQPPCQPEEELAGFTCPISDRGPFKLKFIS